MEWGHAVLRIPWGPTTDCCEQVSLDGRLGLLYDVGLTDRGGSRLAHEMSHGHTCFKTPFPARRPVLGGCRTVRIMV